MPLFVNEKSISQYRENKRKKRKESPDKSNYHLPRYITIETSNISMIDLFNTHDDLRQIMSGMAISPMSTVNQNRNMQCYNNNLGDDVSLTINLTSKFTIIENENRTTKLRKADYETISEQYATF